MIKHNVSIVLRATAITIAITASTGTLAVYKSHLTSPSNSSHQFTYGSVLAVGPTADMKSIQAASVYAELNLTSETPSTESVDYNLVTATNSNEVSPSSDLEDLSDSSESKRSESSTNSTQQSKKEKQFEPYTSYVYPQVGLNVREEPNKYSDVILVAKQTQKVRVIQEVEDSEFVKIQLKGLTGYVSSKYLTTDYDSIPIPVTVVEYSYQGEKLNSKNGTVSGPSGKETYYNLPMGGCIRLMEALGYYAEYWVRSDGCKMYGDYIMIAADTSRYPKGTILETSLGTGMVCDHCESAAVYSGTWIDVAVTW